MSRILRNDFDYTNKDFTAFKAMMISSLRQKMPEYTDLSDSDAGIVIIELCAMGLDIISYYNDVVANEAFFSTLRQRPNALKWCRNVFGYTPRSATPSMYKQVFFLNHLSETDTVIPLGTVVKAQEEGEDIFFETIADHIIPAGKYGNEKTEGEYDYTVDIVQGVSIIQEVIGSSTGAASQSFNLFYYPVITDNIRVYVNNGAEYKEWTNVPTFMDSSPTDTHYLIQDTGFGNTQVVFGDGYFGMIPHEGVSNILCSYRSGGGTEGNLSANKINTLVNPIPHVETFNPDLPYILGAEAESLESIKMNAPNAMRTLWGALTLEDFGAVLVLNFPEISDALCVRAPTVDDIIIYIIMKQGHTLSEEFKQTIQDFFSITGGGRKIVGINEITLNPPNVLGITLTANLIVESFHSPVDIKNKITAYVQQYFLDAATKFSPRYISLTQLMRDILSVNTSGIEGIRSFSFQSATRTSGTPSAGFSITNNIITLTEGDIANLTAITITEI